MPRVVITGHTRGIGSAFYRHFTQRGWEVSGYNTQTGLDTVISDAVGCSLFINNAYAEGKQILFLDELYGKVDKMIICGSVAANYPDPQLPVYSQHKKKLYERFKNLNSSSMLLLHLSAKGYNSPLALLRLVDTWLEFPCFTEIVFDSTGEPNG